MSKLYYISQGQTPEQHLINIQLVAENGADWIQLRLKNHPNEIFLATAQKALEICHRNGAKLFINDKVVIASEVSADGIHIGQDDISPVDAKVIYIGLGPYRFTGTKKELSPILGLEGIRDIIVELRAKGYQTPVVAIGGIEVEDCKELFSIGVSRIAVSGLLTNKSADEIKSIVNQVNGLIKESI